MIWGEETLDGVRSREDLAAFLQRLAIDVREGRRPLEHGSIAAFIDAAGRWVEDMDGVFENNLKRPVPESPDWSMVAAIFDTAVFYE